MSARRARAGDSDPIAPSPDCALARPIARASAVRVGALYALLAVVSLATRMPFLRHPFLNVDEAAHLVGAWEILHGGRLYADFADNKPPLVYLFYAAAQPLSGGGIHAVRLLAALVLSPLTALAASAFFGHGRRGIAAALAFLIASAALLPSDAHAVHCEHVLLLPLAWSVVLVRSPRHAGRAGRLFASGALLGLATLAKQPAAACLLVPLCAALHACRRPPPSTATAPLPPPRRAPSPAPSTAPAYPLWPVLRRALPLCAALAAGFALPLLAAAALFAREGTLGSAIFWIWRFNLGHIVNPMPLADLALHVAGMGALLLPSAGALLAAALLARGRASGHRRLLPAVLAAATFLPALLGMRLFGHYFLPFLFALSLAAAPFLGARGQTRFRGPIVAFGLLALAGFTAVGRVVHDPAHPIADVTRPEYEQIGEALRRDPACGDGSLFVWGYAPEVYAYAEERPASRFVVPIDTLTGYLAGNEAAIQGRIDTKARISAAHWDLLMADLAAHRPAHIVDTAPGDLNEWGHLALHRFPRLFHFVRRDYHPFAVVGGAVLYRRNECAPSRAAAR